jgi:hypothetical protein
MIRLDSRYASGEVLFIRDPKTGNTVPTVFRTVVPSGGASSVYVYKSSDRMDLLGKRFEDRAHLWWRIIDRNSEEVDPMSIPPGASVVIR